MHSRAYFKGFYLKQQSDRGSVALIPAYHTDRQGRASASLQIITDGETACADFPIGAFHAAPHTFDVRLGTCRFSAEGCFLDVSQPGLTLTGALRFTTFTPPKSDIMGPFRFIPGMQCRHTVLSLGHRVTGCLTFNGRTTDFCDDVGYVEGDRGASFPSRYLWTQCGWPDGCVMISVASIPLCGAGFTGCIASVLIGGQEYRLATYGGVRLVDLSSRHILLRQGGLELEATLLEAAEQPLRAPRSGGMTRVIHESLSCKVVYRFSRDGVPLFERTSGRASFESVWDNLPAGRAH